jgi:nucleotide-binding universal stress UspA family protein
MSGVRRSLVMICGEGFGDGRRIWPDFVGARLAMKTILVAIDGSDVSEKALEVALDLAERHKAQVKLLHVLLRDKEPEELLRLPDLPGTGADIAAELARLVEAPSTRRSAEELMADPNLPNHPISEPLLRKVGAHVLRRASARAARRGVAAEVLDLADGAAAPAIVATAEAIGADTIVIGSRGLRQIEAFTFGSVSEEVRRTARCTCIAIH